MKRSTVAILAALLTFAATSAALACSLAPEGWFPATDQIRAQPAGPFVVPLDNYYGYDDALPQVTFDVVDASGEPVAGEVETIYAADGRPFIAFTPQNPLETGTSFTATLDIDQESLPGPLNVTLTPSDESNTLTADLVRVYGLEFARSATRECCQSENCFTDSCDDSGGVDCQACWTTSWAYVVQPRMDIDVAGPTGRFILQLEHVSDTGERTLLGQQLMLEDRETSMGGTEPPDSETLPLCLELTAVDVLTGGSEVVASGCVEDPDVERTDRDRQPETAPDHCKPDSFSEIDETGEENPIEGPSNAQDDGCSAAGTGAASWLLLLIAGMARRRRS